MMGIKERDFRRLPADLSLEVLVPEDNFYGRLEERIDLSFVRELVRPLYAGGGRRSIDPVVFFKLQLILFFEDLRSERRLMEAVADRLSLRWYVGYDLHEPLPDHSSLTRIRERHGLGVFRENPWLRRRGSPCSRYLVRVAGGGPHKDSAGRR
jgi:transposase